MTTTRRALTALATGALTLPLLSVPAAYAVAPEPPAEQSIAALCANVAASYNPFTDDEPNTFTAAIECVAFAGIAQGGPNGRPSTQYGPALSVRRDQMASFIARMIDTADQLDTGNNIKALPPYDNSNAFTDVASDNTHLQAINRLEAAGIVEGGPGGRPATEYGPGLAVTRAQMASFINRAVAFVQGDDPAAAGSSSGYRSTNDYFTDDESFVAHEANINGIASEGIAIGDGRDTYRPGQAIQRDQMAGFLARTLGTLHDAGDILPIGSRLNVTPDTEATLQAVRNPDTSSADDRSFSVSGLDNTKTYRITLVTSENVRRETNGTITFRGEEDSGSSTGYSAVTGVPTADITSVNGSAVADSDSNAAGQQSGTTTTVPADGRIVFTVDGDAAGETVVPVVYVNGAPGRSAADGGSSPRLEVRSASPGAFGEPIEAFDIGGATTFTSAAALPVRTDAPDLVSAAFVRNTGTGETQTTTVRYTFDEPVVTTVTETAFRLYRFDGTAVAPRATSGADAQRDPEDQNSVLVIFDLTAAEFADITLATVDAGAVEDAGAQDNPIGDAPIGSGVTFTAGRSAAPDLLTVDNYRTTGTGTSRYVLLDFTFDEPVFVIDPEPGQFQLILTDAVAESERQQDGAPVTSGSGYAGEGTTKLTIQFLDVDNAITATNIARGIVLSETVSDQAQEDGQLPIGPNPAEGTVNPLQASDTPHAGTGLPELASVDVNERARTVTYVFDEPVTNATANRFRVYDRNGAETAGSSVTDSNPSDATVVVSYTGSALDDVVGASVAAAAVTEANPQAAGAPTRANQEDEIPTASDPVAAGRTTGPDLLSVERTPRQTTTTDPFTGNQSTEVTGVVIRYVFDDDAATVTSGRFFVVGQDGTSTAVNGCARAQDDPAAEGEENVVECTIPDEDDSATPLTNEAAAFGPASSAVAGTVDNGAVTDGEGTPNPEGGARIA